MTEQSQPAGPNQTALELIFAIKALAQAVEYMHSDLRRLLESEGRDRDSDYRSIKEILEKNKQTLAELPIAVADRLEKLVDRIEKEVDGKVDGVLDDVRVSLNEVRQKLWFYLKEKEKEKPAEDTTAIVKAVHDNWDKDVTGRIELRKQGEVRLLANFDWKSLKAAITVGKWAGIGVAGVGGVMWLVDFIRGLF